ncbi:MAG: hypothetical protein P8102_04450 [Gammaproteobacteria bacterium]
MSAASWVLALALMGQPATGQAPPPSADFLEYLGLWAGEDEATVVDFAFAAETPGTAGEPADDPASEEDEDDEA